MNFLAHQLLSFSQKHLMVGNFIADTLKGKSYQSLPKEIQEGVLLHRFIDDFTDTHPLMLQGRKLLYPHFGKYAGVVQDVFCDYFLAKDWHEYHEKPLKEYVQYIYQVLAEAEEIFNERALRTFQFMRQQNWLESYAHLSGIDQALSGLSRRASYQSNMENSLPAMTEHGHDLELDFREFYPQLRNASMEQLKKLRD
ncbi:MAG: ACP phosphodiesterase [Bacteroidota bacterium]